MTMLVEERGSDLQEQPPEEPLRTCSTCGAGMATDQDWCLACGTAAPGRLGSRPGMRAASTIVMVVALLAGGAVAASYAALSDDASRQAAKPAGPSGTPVASVPATSAPAPVTPVGPTGATGAPPSTTPTIPQTTTPTIPDSTTTGPTISLPNTSTSGTPTTIPSPSNTNTTDTTSTNPSTTTETKTNTTKTESDPQPTAVNLPADSVKLYDPYGRLAEQTDPADAYDNDAKSAYSVTAKDGSKMGLGVVVDLESAKAIKEIELATSTPGFRAEIYATDSDELPPDILDTRWAHIKDRSRVDETTTGGNKAGDGKERIVLGGGTVKYRHYVVWLTTPPDAGPTVRLQDIKLLS